MSRRAAVITAALAGVAIAGGIFAARPHPAAPVPARQGSVDWEHELWGQAAVQPAAPAPAARPVPAAKSARAPQQLLTVRSAVKDPPALAQQIVSWVTGRGGLASVTNQGAAKHHVAVKLQGALLPELFAQFPMLAPAGPAPRIEDKLWVNLSIQLDRQE